MVVGLSLSIGGDTQLARSFSRFTGGLRDLRPGWERVSDDLFRITAEQFDSEGGASGGWTPLNPTYAGRKAQVAPGAKILVFSVRMRESLVRKGGAHVDERKKQSMKWGTKVKSPGGFPYPTAHQEGTRLMPKREIFDLTETDKRALTRSIQVHLVEVAKKNGLL